MGNRVESRMPENPEDCWTFKLKANDRGYPFLKRDGKDERVSRLMWELHNGPIPEKEVVRHCCRLYRADKKDNPKCINPLHLTIGTQKKNIQDAQEAGTLAKGEAHGNSKLTVDQVKEIMALKGTGILLREVADKFGVGITTISDLWKGKRWKHVDVTASAVVIQQSSPT